MPPWDARRKTEEKWSHLEESRPIQENCVLFLELDCESRHDIKGGSWGMLCRVGGDGLARQTYMRSISTAQEQ